MTYNVRGQDEVKGGYIGYYHRSDIKPLILEGTYVERRCRSLYLLDVDVMAATS